MKNNYEDRFRIHLPRRTNVIIRVDGKAFHSFTKGLDKPIDHGLVHDMNMTAKYMCENIQGAKFGYVQSDEISIWLTDYDDLQTQGWFDYNIQKMCSIAASLATSKFNQLRITRQITEGFKMMKDENLSIPLLHDIAKKQKLAQFDARVFIIPEIEEVVNYFIWRQQDATRNSISMAAQSMFSHKELHGKSCNQMQDMMMTEKGVNWNDYEVGFKRGRSLAKRKILTKRAIDLELIKFSKMSLVHMQNFEQAAAKRDEELLILKNWTPEDDIVRHKWEILDTPIFTQEREFIIDHDSPKIG